MKYASILGVLLVFMILAPIAHGKHAQPATVAVPCGAVINSYIAAYPSGTKFQLAGNANSHCTYYGQSIHTKNGITIQGDCSSSTGANTILDGGNGSSSGPLTWLASGEPSAFGGDGTTGVTLQCLTIQNYAGSKVCPGTGCGWNYGGTPENWNAEVNTWDGWLLNNCTIQLSGGYAVQLAGSAAIQNCLITRNYHGGITLQTRFPGNDGKPAVVSGNEISYNNLRGDAMGIDASGVKAVSRADLGGATQTIDLLDNYVHDNYATGLWCDIQCSPFFEAEGNTVVNNSGFGIHFEITGIGGMSDISDNVINSNAGFGIFVSSASNVNVHRNNILVRSTSGDGIVFEADCRSDAPINEQNVQVYANTVTFQSTWASFGQQINGFVDATALGAKCSPGQPHPTSYDTLSFHNNNYYSIDTWDGHFTWPPIGYDGVPLAEIQAPPYGSEIGSTITPGRGDVTGCTQIGCTGSGW
jgi:hypothetical protein